MESRSTLAILLILAVQLIPGRNTATVKGYEKLQAWAQAVHAHTPGQWDEPARAIAAFSIQDYRETLADLEALRRMLARGDRLIRYDWPVPPGTKPLTRFRELHINEVRAIFGLAEDRRLSWDGRGGGRTDFNLAFTQLQTDLTPFVKVAAVMEADLAVFATPLRRDMSERGVAALPPDTVFHQILRASDGSGLGSDDAPVHWTLGCAALDLVAPSPSADEMVRLWYRASTAYQEQRRQYGYARPHLDHALKVLPDDAYMYFYTGVMLENIAAPTVQVYVASLSPYLQASGGSAAASLTNAEAALRRALSLEPTLAVARLRLARVVSLRGRHIEAAGELRSLIPLLTRDVDRYYAQLFLGAEESSLGRLDAAGSAYQQAASLFPRAQSPWLALSQLAWHQGDSVAARTAFLALADLPSSAADRDDPWWSYDISPAANAQDLLSQVRALAVKEKEQLR